MNLVIAIDGQESASSALEYILKQKYTRDTKIHLIHVIAPGFAEVAVEGIPDVIADEKQEEQALLDSMVRNIKESLNFDASAKILNGEIAEVVAQECKEFDADQVLVPSHARHGFSRIWFGSVADGIVDAAPCTVVVLKMVGNKP